MGLVERHGPLSPTVWEQMDGRRGFAVCGSLMHTAGWVLTASAKVLLSLGTLINARVLETPSLGAACVGIHGGWPGRLHPGGPQCGRGTGTRRDVRVPLPDRLGEALAQSFRELLTCLGSGSPSFLSTS